ncbi:MAG: PfkB family carbohydrate kinase [Melioribacteraceae bacterium]|nr:PfkB family carbohydrate kinase [Melioribacteraceae bacterium]
MVLTVTLNPLLEHRLYFNDVKYQTVNRSYRESFSAGGKGINVSRQLNKINIKNQAATFIGGNNGKLFRSILASEGIELIPISSKQDLRSASLIINESEKSLTTFFSPDKQIPEDESADLMNKLDKMIQNCSTVVFSGSSPSQYTDIIFSYGIELANKYDKISILDTYGKHLSNSIEASPTIIHNTKQEIEYSFGISLSDENEIRDYLNLLYKKGIKLAFITDGGNPVYASKFDFHYKCTPQEIVVLDATGSGDSFTAGLTYGMEQALVFEDFFKLSVALASANASKWETSSISLEDAEKLLPLIKIEPIGKKMKILDDSPTI